MKYLNLGNESIHIPNHLALLPSSVLPYRNSSSPSPSTIIITISQARTQQAQGVRTATKPPARRTTAITISPRATAASKPSKKMAVHSPQASPLAAKSAFKSSKFHPTIMSRWWPTPPPNRSSWSPRCSPKVTARCPWTRARHPARKEARREAALRIRAQASRIGKSTHHRKRIRVRISSNTRRIAVTRSASTWPCPQTTTINMTAWASMAAVRTAIAPIKPKSLKMEWYSAPRPVLPIWREVVKCCTNLHHRALESENYLKWCKVE